jgi:hypothetical protein
MVSAPDDAVLKDETPGSETDGGLPGRETGERICDESRTAELAMISMKMRVALEAENRAHHTKLARMLPLEKGQQADPQGITHWKYSYLGHLFVHWCHSPALPLTSPRSSNKRIIIKACTSIRRKGRVDGTIERE